MNFLLSHVFIEISLYIFFPAAGQDAPYSALPGCYLLSSAVFWCCPLPANEWEKAHLDLPCVWQEGCIRESHYWWVSWTSLHFHTLFLYLFIFIFNFDNLVSKNMTKEICQIFCICFFLYYIVCFFNDITIILKKKKP